ncbi:hypothetical protein M8745_16050 [Lutimaribacter sp. EGI FJ00014]|nr:hypothetical protein [Lutimaribacter sp. EGI FJ00014]
MLRFVLMMLAMIGPATLAAQGRSLGEPAPPAPRLHEKTGWHAMEARNDSRERGAAMYVSRHDTRRDMMRVSLEAQTNSVFLPISWYDFRAGEADYLARIHRWILDHEKAREEHRAELPDDMMLFSFGPRIPRGALEMCKEGLGSGASIEDLSYCMAETVLGTAALKFSVMMDVRAMEENITKPQIKGFKELALWDMAGDRRLTIHALERGKTCSNDERLELCVRCTRNFTDLVRGVKGVTAECGEKDDLISITAIAPYGPFFAAAARMKEPRLVLVFHKGDNDTYSLRYALDGLHENLLSESVVHPAR